MDFILASASPRRREILSLAGYTFEVVTSDADESFPEGTPPERAVIELAQRKAEAVAVLRPSDTIVSADTVVYCDGRILGKPADAQDAFEMLSLLSGREHSVFTGVTLLTPDREVTFSVETRVKFRELCEEEIRGYIATGEPLDKAGAYGIQGRGALLAERIDGDFFNVVGLPVSRLNTVLRENGVI